MANKFTRAVSQTLRQSSQISPQTPNEENDPIKHTAGGEMPDPNEVSGRRFRPDDFQDIGATAQQGEQGVQGGERDRQRSAPSQSWYGGGPDSTIGNVGTSGSSSLKDGISWFRSHAPNLVYGAGLGIGLYFLLRRSKWSRSSSESEWVSKEARRAMDIDTVPPSRLMGA